jgi:tripartite-type tricarboxylate transporter receptor subunit TctC
VRPWRLLEGPVCALSRFQKKYLERFAVQPVPGALDAFAEYLRKDSAKWGEVIHTAHVKIE